MPGKAREEYRSGADHRLEAVFPFAPGMRPETKPWTQIQMVADVVLGFIAQAGVDSEVGHQAPVILHEDAEIELPGLLVRNPAAQRKLARATSHR